jgi:hypothetical protein
MRPRLSSLTRRRAIDQLRFALFPLHWFDARNALFPFEYHAGLIDLLHAQPESGSPAAAAGVGFA